MANKIPNPKCAKCGKSLFLHLGVPGLGHSFVRKTAPPKEKEKLKKMKTGGFIEPGIENID